MKMYYTSLAALIALLLVTIICCIFVYCNCKRTNREDEYPYIYSQYVPEAVYSREWPTQNIGGDLVSVPHNLANECAVCLRQFNAGVNNPHILANECAVCLRQFNAGESSRVLSCGHYYHTKCVDPWLRKGKSCPKCRGENVV